MLEIRQIVSKWYVDKPTAPLPNDLPAILLLFFDIFGVIRAVTWFTFTSAIEERSDKCLRLGTVKLCKHASSAGCCHLAFKATRLLITSPPLRVL